MKTFIKHYQTKAVAILLSIFLSGTFVQAQDITGKWEGVFECSGYESADCL